VLLSHMYASASRRSDALEVSGHMKQRQVQKSEHSNSLTSDFDITTGKD
jgi:hypothetical protein